MINYISKDVAITELELYLKTIEEDDIGYYVPTKNIEKYIFTGTFNFDNLLKKYITETNKLLEFYCDDELFTLKDDEKIWNVCILNNEMFFENIFVLKNIIFINLSRILDIVEFSMNNKNYNNMDTDFIKELIRSRIYIIQYYNFEDWKLHIEQYNDCHIVKKSNFITNNKLKILKNINISFMDNFYCLHGNNSNIFNYIIVKNVEDKQNSTNENDIIKYAPFYNVHIIKTNENIIDYDDILGINLFDNFVDYFESYNMEIVKHIFN